jgi:lytic murein transglycosylase
VLSELTVLGILPARQLEPSKKSSDVANISIYTGGARRIPRAPSVSAPFKLYFRGSRGRQMLRASIIILFLFGLLPSYAWAEARIALLIGNKDYKPGVGALINPVNDIRIVGEALKAIGFELLKPVQNARRADMLIAIHRFAEKLRNAGSDAVGFLYYSGHGIASAGENYLIPVDVDEPSTVQLQVHGVTHSEVLTILRSEAPNAVHYLILDACRNTLQGARGGKGFLPAEQQSGVLVGFAAEPGKTASDSGQGSGPYAAALAAELVKPDQSDLIMFHNVRIVVMEKTGGDQVPWTEDGIQRRDRVQFGGTSRSAEQSQSGWSTAEREWQQYAKNTKDIRLLEAFREKHKADPVYVRLAELRIEQLKREEDKRVEVEHQAWLRQKEEEEKKKQAEEEARATAEAELQRAALLQKREDDKKRAEELKKEEAAIAAPLNLSSDEGFQQLIAELWPDAQALGITRGTFELALRGVTPDPTLPDLVLSGKGEIKGQAEFTQSPAEYLSDRTLARLSAQGRALLTKHAPWFDRIERELGVQRQFVLAIWGRGTAFRTEHAGYYAIQAYATQAYMGRRKEMFRTELLYALKMLADGVRTRDNMLSFRDGTMGLTQFMPSDFYTLAYDLDGDGTKDIWDSIPDALASIANKLRHVGWVSGESWGYEVELPKGTLCLIEGLDRAQPVRAWIKLGVVRTSGTAFPPAALDEQAFILAPAGAHGPTFLAFENFLALKRYNMSDLYALFVGNLGDRIAGGGGFDRPWANIRQLSATGIEEIQERLVANGYPVAKIDGKVGMNTRAVIGAYQKSHGLAVDCWPTQALIGHLRSLPHRDSGGKGARAN